jgi:eukaryotic-like serine/threonine-protein kinase
VALASHGESVSLISIKGAAAPGVGDESSWISSSAKTRSSAGHPSRAHPRSCVRALRGKPPSGHPDRPPIDPPRGPVPCAGLIGATLGHRYELVRLLGQGGMGSVYEAEHRESRARVAVKVLHGHLLAADGEGPRRFHREAEAARAIRSEHVVQVLDAGTDEATGQLYLVTEHLEGEDLQRLLDRTGALAPDAALRVAWQALAGLGEAHAAGVVHRDVKPANIFLARGPDGAVTVKILDFGIAKVRVDPLALPGAAGLTTTGGILGSPLYMSPEQVQSSRDVDHRTDLWSLGCVLYASLAGRAPHQHLASIGQLLVAICVSPAPPLAEIAPWVPPAIADVVGAALEIDPDLRYPSAAAMRDALRPLVPSGALDLEMLVPSGELPREVVSPRPRPATPARFTPRIVVASEPAAPIRGDEVTEQAARVQNASGGSDTLPSAQTGEHRIARSGVPAVGVKGARVITVDPRRLLGPESELWTLSLDVHRDVSSLVARIWRSLARAGAKVPPRTYGTTWALVEPRTGRTIVERSSEDGARSSIEAAGILPGAVLWVVRLEVA